MSLENHLAWFLREVSSASDDAGLFWQGERALETCIERSVLGNEWTLDESTQDTIGKRVSLHDAQLGAVPGYLYVGAWARLQAFVKSGQGRRAGRLIAEVGGVRLA